jgi:hypothetical protein
MRLHMTPNLVPAQLEFTLRETALVEDESHNCESLTERIKECQPYIEEVSMSIFNESH